MSRPPPRAQEPGRSRHGPPTSHGDEGRVRLRFRAGGLWRSWFSDFHGRGPNLRRNTERSIAPVWNAPPVPAGAAAPRRLSAAGLWQRDAVREQLRAFLVHERESRDPVAPAHCAQTSPRRLIQTSRKQSRASRTVRGAALGVPAQVRSDGVSSFGVSCSGCHDTPKLTACPPPSLPYKVDTSRPSLRTNWTRLVPLQRDTPKLTACPLRGGLSGCRDTAALIFGRSGSLGAVDAATRHAAGRQRARARGAPAIRGPAPLDLSGVAVRHDVRQPRR